MNKMKKVFKVAIYELKLMCFSSKFLILSVLAFIIMDVTVRGYRMFSHDYNLPIAPAVLPFYFADVSFIMFPLYTVATEGAEPDITKMRYAVLCVGASVFDSICDNSFCV